MTFGSPRIEEDEIREVEDSLRTGWLGTGPKVDKFQRLFQKYIGSKYAIALNSCTAALHLAMLVTGVREGDEVITSPLTFCATANAVIHTGAKPIFVDVNRQTMNINPILIERSITKKTKAIIPVHFAGRPCDMAPIMDIARRYKLLVVEDAAHCIEGVYKGKKIGTIGDITCFSFYVTKNITTGEGGMITTDSEKWADKIKMYSLHGLDKDAWMRYSDKGFRHYEVIFPGFKYNMMDLQAAIGIHQLKHINSYLARRNEIWKRYDSAFKDLPISLPSPEQKDTLHARHLYTILVDEKITGMSRDKFQQRLYELNVGTGIHYTALHLNRYYRQRYGFKAGDFPNAEFISDRTISLPLSAKLSDEDVVYVIEAVKEITI